MPPNIYKNNLVLYRTPAWHHLGHVTQTPLTAPEAAQLLDMPAIYLAPTYYQYPNGTYTPVPNTSVILGEHTTGIHSYGVVSDRYHLFTHRQALGTWADVLGTQPIETIGLLGKGDTLFITTELPAFAVKGDEVTPYLALINPCKGFPSYQTIRACLTPIRMVCQNTVNLGLSCATESLTVNHLSDPSQRVHTWLADVWARTVGNIRVVQEALELLANTEAYDLDMKYVARQVYATTTRPDTQDLDTLAAWEKANKRQLAHQEACLFMFQDSETITSATRGTLWGVYNAVAEYEDHFKIRNTAYNKMFGESAARKQHAFNLCMNILP